MKSQTRCKHSVTWMYAMFAFAIKFQWRIVTIFNDGWITLKKSKYMYKAFVDEILDGVQMIEFAFERVENTGKRRQCWLQACEKMI